MLRLTGELFMIFLFQIPTSILRYIVRSIQDGRGLLAQMLAVLWSKPFPVFRGKLCDTVGG